TPATPNSVPVVRSAAVDKLPSLKVSDPVLAARVPTLFPVVPPASVKVPPPNSSPCVAVIAEEGVWLTSPPLEISTVAPELPSGRSRLNDPALGFSHSPAPGLTLSAEMLVGLNNSEAATSGGGAMPPEAVCKPLAAALSEAAPL